MENVERQVAGGITSGEVPAAERGIGMGWIM
jgi:hypothetical protein